MKKIFTSLFVFVIINVFAQDDLYDINTIQTIEIEFAQDNWDELLDIEKAGDNNYTEAESVTINGTLFETVGVKFKGNSSYSANNDKNPFHIELDTYIDQDYQGYTDIKLSNVVFDPTFVRETVAYSIVNQYMDAPQSNYANVYVNGDLIGMYINSESVSKKFVKKHFGSNDNAFFNCSPPDGAGPNSTVLPSLEYLGDDYTAYEEGYEIKSGDDEDATIAEAHWANLIDLTKALDSDIDTIEDVLDVDMALWMLAFDNVMVNLDSCIGAFQQNYYLYKDDNGQFKPIVWDLNMSFGTFGDTGGSEGTDSGQGGGPGGGRGGGAGTTLNSTADKAELDHLLHVNDDTFPLLSKLLAVDTYKRMYLAHYKTIFIENISSENGEANYLTLANEYHNIIEDDALEGYTFSYQTQANFLANIDDTDVTVGNNTAPGLTALMNARATYLSSQSDFTNTQPTINTIASSNNAPTIGDTIKITANVSDANDVYIGYRSDESVPFTKLLMNNLDGAYSIDLVIDNAFTQYYIYAENDNIGAFSPARAQYEFYTINATYEALSFNIGDLVINEILAANEAGETDEDGENEDWIELYNTSNTTLSLDNVYLSDDVDDTLIYGFPEGTTLAPDSYLVVWCDKDEDQGDLHADFKLSSDGETVILSYVDGTVLEEITFGVQVDDISYARSPNGVGDFVNQAPTFGTNNDEGETLSISDIDFYNNLKQYPNPVSHLYTIESDLTTIESVEVFNVIGEQLFTKEVNENLVNIDFSNYISGIYIVVVNKHSVFKVVKE